MRLREVSIGLVLAGYALGSSALTLGRVRGAAWIGQGLDLTVTVQVETGNTDAAVCAEADVFYADNRQEGARIRVTQQPSTEADAVLVRVVSTAAVDEPVVTLYLRAGCGQKVTRKYVLLADFPSEASSVAPAPRVVPEPPSVPLITSQPDSGAIETPQAGTSATGSNLSAQSTSAATPAQTAPEVAAKPAMRAPAKTDVARKPAAPRPRPNAVAAAPLAAQKLEDSTKRTGTGRPRLKLDPLENLAERIRLLESAAAAAPAPPEDSARETQRMEQMQNDVKALLQQASKNDATLLALRARLEQAESERVPMALVYGLAALVVACLGAIAFLWSRRRDSAPWQNALPSARIELAQPTATSVPTMPSHPSTPVVKGRGDAAAGTRAAAVSPSTSTQPLPVQHSADDSSGLDVNLMEMDHESFGELMSPTPTGPSELMHELDLPQIDAFAVTPHVDFNSESIMNACQQAEFFDRLGKTDEAITALEQRITESRRECPLLYLELLHIANARSLKTDFRQFRDEFQEGFHCNVPEFALFRDEGRDLEAYPEVMQHIRKHWGTPKVLEVLETFIFRDPWDKEEHPFDMAAFGDLIALHGVARTGLLMSNDQSQQHIDLDL